MMNGTGVNHGQFAHRENPDGTWSSFCTQCLMTVASMVRESDLVGGERSHVCDPLEVARLARVRVQD